MIDRITWNMDPGDYFAALTLAQADAIEADIVALVESLLDPVEAQMKQMARWQDRTGAARRGLFTDMQHVARQAVYLLMSHDVTLDYTWMLEANPRFAILGDAADYAWPLLYQGVRQIVAKHGG